MPESWFDRNFSDWSWKAALVISQDAFHQVYLKLYKRFAENQTDVTIHCWRVADSWNRLQRKRGNCDVVWRRAKLSRDTIPIKFRNMKNWFKTYNAIQRRGYTSEIPAVQAVPSSVLPNTKRMRCEASSVVAHSGRQRRRFSSYASKTKSEGAPLRK